mmetsp:Transcript_4310/g.3596  ORF Transcript_4310/g.3596 Transcript_4310/m.3596 type:complete len:120 (-) Transcript_4310:562-921(-)
MEEFKKPSIKYVPKTQKLPNGETYEYIHLDTDSKEKNPKTLLLIHGSGGSCTTFEKIFPQLRKHFKVYALSLRGFGGSSYKSPYFTVNELAKDIKEFCDEQKIARACILGHSFGGGVAL